LLFQCSVRYDCGGACHKQGTTCAQSLRGTAVALFAFALFLGGGLGTYLAGLAIDNLGYPARLLGAAVALAVFTAASWPLLRVGGGDQVL
jgi:hypothetical protein